MAGTGFFGQFLLERGLINRDQLLAATRLVDSRNVRFGDMAIALGMLNSKIRDQVVRRQTQEGRKFGEVALEMGVMKPEEISQVLAAQQKRNVAISDALVELGALTRETVDSELVVYNSSNPKARTLDLHHLTAQEHRDFVRCTSRLLDEIAGLSAELGDCEVGPDSYHAAMRVHAFGWCEFHLIANKPLVSRVTAGWTRGWIQTPELLGDVFLEFLNTAVGKTFASSPVGRRVTMEPPYSAPQAVPAKVMRQTLITPAGCIAVGFARGRTQSTRATPAVPDPGDGESDSRMRTVVVADASAAVRRRIRDMLVELGADFVEEADNAALAVELAGQLKPALLVCELALPGRPGLETLKAILAASPQTHVVVTTSADQRDQIDEVLRSGASGCLTKPLSMPLLQAALAKLYLV